MTTTKSVIANNISTTLSSIYTNNSGGNAVLKALNIDGLSDPSAYNPTTTSTLGADEWSYFGSSIMPLIGTSTTVTSGFGIPNVVKLSANRLLLIWLPNGTHMGGQLDFMGGNTIHTQVVEYQSDLGRYVAGPIVDVKLPTATFNSTTYSLRTIPANMVSNSGHPCLRGVALTPTKVAIAYRQNNTDFRLMRLNLVGNAVDLTSITNLDLTGATYFNTANSGAFDLSIVPGNSNKLMIGGWATSNWSVQVYNIPDTGALSSATTLYSTGIGVSTYSFALSNIVKAATADVSIFIAAGTTAATTGSMILLSYNSSTDSLTTTGAAAAITGTTAWAGLVAHCVSTGTSVNGVVAATSSGATSVVTFYRQSSGSAAQSSPVTFSLQSSAIRQIASSFNWGDERVIISGDSMHVVYDSAGNATNLIPTTLSTAANRVYPIVYPFDSRPLYNAYDPATIRAHNSCQLYARVNMSSSTDVGTLEFNGNYMPWGHDYGNNYQWHTLAGCWIVASYGRLYALSTTGVVLDEISLYSLFDTWNYQYTCKMLTITPSGKILLAVDYRIGSFTSNDLFTQWNSLSNGMAFGSTQPINSPYQLSKAVLSGSPTAVGSVCVSITAFQDYSGTDRAHALLITSAATPTVNSLSFADNAWAASAPTVSVGSTTGASYHCGFRPNFRLIQDTPCNLTYPLGQWRIIGSQAMTSQTNYGYLGSSVSLAPGSFGSLNPASYSLSTSTPLGYSIAFRQSDNIVVASVFDSFLNNARVWASVRGRMTYPIQGWFNTANNSSLGYVSVQASKFNYSIALNNVSGNTGNGRAYVFNEANVNAPIANVSTPAVANGHGVWTHKTYDKLTVSLFSNTTNTVNTSLAYTTIGSPDFNKIFVAISDVPNNTVFLINGGQSLSSNGYFRTNDTYVIPNGYSLQMRAESQNCFMAMATVVEEI